MRHPLALAVIVLVVVVGCQSSDPSGRPEPRPTDEQASSAAANGDDEGAGERCEGPAGSPTDVAHEPDWRPWADYWSWTTVEGCLVRIDVLADRPGPDHCGFQDARVIITGDRLGERYTDADDTLTYVRDPDGVFGQPELAAPFDPSATLPDDAVDSGYRQGDDELWTVPDDQGSTYLVTADATERWPLGGDPPCF